MATPSNPTGISTGQGRGEAQVFGNTYNPFFKEKLTDAKAKNKEVTDAIAKLSDPGSLWSRDVQAFKPKLDGLRQFYRDNAQKIIKGDFDTTLKLKELQNDASQYITSSKSTEKQYFEALKAVRDNPDKFYKKDVDRIMSFGSQGNAGNFDFSDSSLRPLYHSKNVVPDLQKQIKDLGYDLDQLEVKKIIGTDVEVLVDSEGQKVDIDALMSARKASDSAFYSEEQVNEIWTPEFSNNVESVLKDTINKNRKSSQVMDWKAKADYRSNINKAKNPLNISDDLTVKENIPTAWQEGGVGVTSGDVTKKYPINFEPGKVKISFSGSPDAVYTSGEYKFKYAPKSGKEIEDVKMNSSAGKDFDNNVLREKFSDEGSYNLTGISVVNAFADDAVGTKKKGSLSGQLVPDGYKGNQPTEGRAYAKLVDDRREVPRVIYVPVSQVESELVGDYKVWWKEKKEELVAKLQAEGNVSALKDLGITSKPKEKVVPSGGLNDAQKKTIADIRAKNPEATKGLTDQDIINQIP